MKICFFSGDITRVGGTERVSLLIANEFARRETCEVVYLSLCESGEKPGFYMDERIRHYALNDRWLNPGPGYLKLIPRVKKFLKKERVDVVIDIDPVLDVLSVWVKKAAGVKVISWEHFNYKVEMQTLYRKAIMRLFTRRTDAIVTLTQKDAELFQAHMGKYTRIYAVHNPMPEKKCEIPDVRKKQIVTVGNVNMGKGMDLLAKTAQKVLEKNPDWKWIVAGTGEMTGFLETFIGEHGLGGKLILAGRVEDVDTLLAQSSVFVLTSRSEGLPMCLLEAKVYRVPIVSFDIEMGPNEIVTDGVNGYLIRPFDTEEMTEKLNRLIKDEELRRDFSRKASIGEEKFGMQRIMEQWMRILEEL